jgi:hypothetical protein
MAYNLTDEEFLDRLITDPSWCLFYQRDRTKRALPVLVKAFKLVQEIKEIMPNLTLESLE